MFASSGEITAPCGVPVSVGCQPLPLSITPCLRNRRRSSSTAPSLMCWATAASSLSWCWKEQGRSQSPHSSDEAGNDRGAKEDRKVEA